MQIFSLKDFVAKKLLLVFVLVFFLHVTNLLANYSEKGKMFLSEITVSDFTVNEDDSTASFDITLNTDEIALGALTLDYQTNDNTAFLGSDYKVTSSGTLNFSGTNGEVQSVTITLVNDAMLESVETLFITIPNPSNPIINVLDDNGVGTIFDDDAPNRSILVSDFRVSEAAVTADFILTYYGVTLGCTTFRVDYTITDGSATNSEDYTATTVGTINFARTSGETQSIFITIIDKNIIKTAETLNAALSSISNPLVNILDGNSVGTINDNDSSGSNDGLYIDDLQVNKQVCNFIFEVQFFNRWEDKVYETKEYCNDYWNGSSPSGSIGSSSVLPSGTYYIISATDSNLGTKLKPFNRYIYLETK